MKKTFTEEELEETGEDQQEEQLQPESGSNKRSAEAQLHDAAADSDEDLPEVVSMIEGKSMAQQLRNEEKASERRIAAEVKRKKQERAASRKNQKSSEKLGLSSQKELRAEVDNTDLNQSNTSGLLDDSIVQFLSSREKAEVDEVKLVSSPRAEVVKIKRLKPKSKQSNSRVQVVDLSRTLSMAEECNALKFRQAQLYGSRIRRDPSMLRNLTRIPGK